MRLASQDIQGYHFVNTIDLQVYTIMITLYYYLIMIKK
jgi:hypothetical protein